MYSILWDSVLEAVYKAYESSKGHHYFWNPAGHLSDFESRVIKDIEVVEQILGEITPYNSYVFKLITSKDQPIFMFYFQNSTSFSSHSLYVDKMAQLFDIRIYEGAAEQCTSEDHESHAFLLPFFCDNKRLQRLHGGNEVNLLQAELARVQTMPYLKTPFKIGPHPNGATWKEEIWTERLGNGMKKYIGNNWTVILGADIEFDSIQHLCSGISYVNSKEFYLFSGQPDITLLRESPETTSIINMSDGIASIANDEEESETEGKENIPLSKQPVDGDSEAIIIENKKQVVTMVQMQDCVVPKVIGQLLATLHFVIAAKLIRMVVKGNCCKALTTRGLLVQKCIGCYICEMTITFTTDIESVPELTIICPDDTGPVSCGSLCTSISACIHSMDLC